jgi:hypothetical protein
MFWLTISTQRPRRPGRSARKSFKDSIEVPNMGWLTIIGDPTGAALGFWQPKQET